MDPKKYEYEVDCSCNNVPYEQIMKVIIEKNCKSCKEVRNHLRVANRCRMCEPFIDAWCKKRDQNLK